MSDIVCRARMAMARSRDTSSLFTLASMFNAAEMTDDVLRRTYDAADSPDTFGNEVKRSSHTYSHRDRIHLHEFKDAEEDVRRCLIVDS